MNHLLKPVNLLNYFLWGLIIISVVRSNVPYKPRFVTPNKLNHDNKQCSQLLPERTLDCPIYGVRTIVPTNNEKGYKFKTQNEIEQLCKNLNFASCESGEYLFPDGICRSCPSNYPHLSGSGTGDLWCENDHGVSLTFENPFNCLGSNSIQRDILHSYRPCLWTTENSKVTFEHYYKGDDYSGNLTMQHCLSSLLGHVAFETELTSHMVLTESNINPGGFLKCPIPPPTYSFFSSGWILFYCTYIIGFLIIQLYKAYKTSKENSYFKMKQTQSETEAREFTILPEIEDSLVEKSDIHKMYQLGYKKTLYGTVAWVSFWIMSWAWNIFFLLIIFDFYGLWWNTLCPSYINEMCADNNPYNWRSGFKCTTGCLFSFRWTTGTSPYWPYDNNSGGIEQIYAVILCVFVATALWWIATICFYGKIYFFFMLRCPLHSATTVLCSKIKEKDLRVDIENENFFVKMCNLLEKSISKYFGTHLVTETCPVFSDGFNTKYIVFQCINYTYDRAQDEYILKTINIAKTKLEIHNLGLYGLASSEATSRIKVLGENKINYEVPSWSTTIWDEFFNIFYLYQFIFLWIWFSFYYWLPSLTILIVIFVSAVISMCVKRSSQNALKTMSEQLMNITVKRDGTWIQLPSSKLVPGDIVIIKAGDQITFDSVLVSGRGVLNESSLTGEPTPVPKLSVPCLDESFGLQVDDMRYTLLAGTTVESVTPGPSGHTLALVLSTGIHTKQGNLVRSMLFPPRLRFKFDDHFTFVFIILFIYGILMMVAISYLMHWYAISIYFGLFTIANSLSPLIPAMFTAGQAHCSQQLKKKNIFCTEMSRTFVAAKVKIFCFDKTGTLTKQGMEYHGISQISVDNHLHYLTDSSMLKPQTRILLGCCHELEFIMNENTNKINPLGNEVDLAMFEASHFEYSNSSTTCNILYDKVTENNYKILKTFEFNRETMTMSVLVEELSSKKIYVYSKGSYERVASFSTPDNLPKDLTSTATKFAMAGHYILGIAMKEISSNTSISDYTRQDAESSLTFMGLLHFKNELKSDTRDVIEHLNVGDIQCIMITGDNLYTACAIAQESGLSTSPLIIIGDVPDGYEMVVWRNLTTLEEVSILSFLDNSKVGHFDLAITNKAFDLLRNISLKYFLELSGSKKIESYPETDAMRYLLKYTRIFARMKPEHKVEVVRMNMEIAVTGMCGDGANDAAALRLAHCGIAIASGGGHATIVAPFSSSGTSLTIVTEVIRYGRGTLATAFAGYKRLIMTGQTIMILKLFLYHFAVQVSDLTWIFSDGLINVTIALAMIQSKPAQRLSPSRPTSALLGKEVVSSVLVQVLITFFTFLSTFIFLFKQPFFSCKNFDSSTADLTKWWTMGDNFESSVLSILTLFLLINQAFVFNIGFEYRRWWFKNYFLLILWALFSAIFYTVLFAPPSFLPCLFRINCGDNSLLQFWSDRNLISFSQNVFIPPGCPCNQQIGFNEDLDFTCENEYINCTSPQYNSAFHHTIFPQNFRLMLLVIILTSFFISLFFEWAVINGPVRLFLRKFNRNLSPCKSCHT